MYVGAGYVSLDTSECRSLKQSRSIVKSLITKTKSKFNNAAISQVGNANNFKVAVIGVSVLSNDKIVTQTMIAKVLEYLEEYSFRTILDSNVEILSI